MKDLKLDKDFLRMVDRLNDTYGEEFLALNGFSEDYLNYSYFIDAFAEKNVTADVSIDGNANASSKDICSLESEMSKPFMKLLSFNKIFYELKKEYGLKTAQEWLEAEWSGAFYLHDANSASFKPYCFAHDLSQLAEKGLFFIDNFAGGAPQHLTVFTDFVAEYVSYCSNRSSGAVGLPDFLIWSYYFWKKDCASGHFIQNPDYYLRQEAQRIIYKLNQPYLRRDQSAFTNFNLYDRPYMEAVFGGRVFPDGSLVIDQIEDIIKYQKTFMEVCSQVRNENMMTFPVLTVSLLRAEDQFVDEEFAKWACQHNMTWNDLNFYCSESIDSLANCCRLVSNIEDTYFNSIGGTALQVGSIKVNTINLARIAYETKEPSTAFFEKLKERVELCLKALHIVRKIISRNVEKGFLPVYDYNLMDLKNQYNTIGLNGVYEAAKALDLIETDTLGNHTYSLNGVAFIEEVLSYINEVKDEFLKDKDYMANVEQSPAERCAAINQKKDTLLFPKQVISDLPLYGNQWVPLGIKTSLFEKINLSAIFDKACNGGSIMHLNLDAPLTDFNQAWKLLNYVANEGVVYFAFCVRINSCVYNHGFYGDICPKCGSSVNTTWQRIVGFLTPLSSYSKERTAEFKIREWLAKGDLM